jgi:hypothetical protein
MNINAKNCSSYIITVTATRTIRQNPVEPPSAAIHDDATRRKSHCAAAIALLRAPSAVLEVTAVCH